MNPTDFDMPSTPLDIVILVVMMRVLAARVLRGRGGK